MPEPRQGPLLDRRLWHRTAIQSFAFDERRARMYALQVMEGGIQLPDEEGPLSHGERLRRGDLCMNALSMTGEPLGHMYLRGFGHGGTMGVETRHPGRPALWTEWDASSSTGNGRGLARFRFRPGAVLEHHDGALDTFRPRPGSTKNQVALDPYARRLLLRYRRSGAYRFALYDLDRFRAGNFQALTDFVQPMPDGHLYHQGMAVYGNYAYQLTCSENGPSAEPLLTCVHLGTGRTVQRVRPAPASGAACSSRRDWPCSSIRAPGCAWASPAARRAYGSSPSTPPISGAARRCSGSASRAAEPPRVSTSRWPDTVVSCGEGPHGHGCTGFRP